MSRELEALRAENERLRTLLALAQQSQAVIASTRPTVATVAPKTGALVHAGSPAAAKLALIRALFRGRDDLYALRFENAQIRKSGYVPAVAGGWTPADPKSYLPFNDEAIERHLRGSQAIGIYPLLADDRCWFLAVDLDGPSWQLDALALIDVAAARRIQVALERSRSGDGAHLWAFFAEAVTAAAARRLGALLLREAMMLRAELDLGSYDRLFPSQDTLPQKGFGNLIALPLQGRCRAKGTSVFLDPATLEPWPDQWAFLSGIEHVTPEQLDRLVDGHEDLPVGLAAITTSRRPSPHGQLRAEIACTISTDIAITKAGLPAALVTDLKHLASLHNPLFHERQRLRLSTHQTPRLIRCYEEDLTHLRLPRGLLAQVEEAVSTAGSRLTVSDARPHHEPVAFTFAGTLTPLQEAALDAILAHDEGVLVAPPGTGKTVIGCAVIAARALPTLVLAHRKTLLEQWRAQLETLLGLSTKQIGQLGDGRHKQTGIVDLAMIQSLKAVDDLERFFAGYGLVVIDECHHLPAFSFETCLRKAPVRHLLGLTATPYRRDGLQEIVTMQCGPIRHQITPAQGPAAGLSLQLEVRETGFTVPAASETPIQEVFRLLVEDDTRTVLICNDVMAALDAGRRCLVLSQWKQHCDRLAEALRVAGASPLALDGSLGKRERKAVIRQLENTPMDEPLVVVATGQYLGEGFDCPQLDTLFLAFPVSFKGRLVQYTGRLMRTSDGKTSIRVQDYADTRVPVLRAMHNRRLKTYRALGFQTGGQGLGGVSSSQLPIPLLSP